MKEDKQSQKEIILNHLRKYGVITLLDAVNIYKICRLSAIIKELRNEGYCIATILKQGKFNKYGNYILLAEPNENPNIWDAKEKLKNYKQLSLLIS